MASFASAAFSTSAFSVRAFDFDSSADTHDGFHEVEITSFEDENRRIEEMRGILKNTLSEDAYEEVRQIVPEQTKRLESGRIEIDWDRVQKKAAAQLYEYLHNLERKAAAERERQLDEDDEDVILLVAH